LNPLDRDSGSKSRSLARKERGLRDDNLGRAAMEMVFHAANSPLKSRAIPKRRRGQISDVHERVFHRILMEPQAFVAISD
jgi:hypothetical protein